jgi:hypothetical protein
VCDVLVIAATTGRTRQHELRRAAQLAWERPARQVAVSLDVPATTARDATGVTR